MKKVLLVLIVVMISVSLALAGSACKVTTEETTAAEGTTAVGEETATAEEESVVAEEMHTYIIVQANWSHPWYDDWRAGIEVAKDFFKVNIEVYGPEDANMEQMLVDQEQAIAANPDGIITNAFIPEQIEGLNKAVAQGIPVVFVNGAFEEVDYLSFVGTDNPTLGKTLAQEFINRVGTSGKVGIISQLTAANHVQRYEGILSVLEQYPDIEVVDILDGFNDINKTIDAAKTLIAKTPDIAAIFTTDASGPTAVITASKEAGKAPGEIAAFCADFSEVAGEGIKDGYLTVVATQSPALEPFYAVAVLEQYLSVIIPLPLYKPEMKTVPVRIISPTPVIDINNVDDFMQ